MKRVWIAVLLLAIVCGLGISEYYLNTKEADYTVSEIQAVQKLVKEGKSQPAKEKFRNLKEDWERKTGIMSIFVSHKPIDEISCSISTAYTYLENDDTPEFFAECERAECHLRYFKELEYPKINNIF